MIVQGSDHDEFDLESKDQPKGFFNWFIELPLWKKILFILIAILVLVVIVFLFLLIPFVNTSRTDIYKALIPYSSLNQTKINELDSSFADMNTDGFTVLLDGKLYHRGGKDTTLGNIASCRKSILSVLFGIAVEKGLINISKSLREIGFDDSVTPLTELEKSATIQDLLKARSGVYLYSIGSSPSMLSRAPARGSHAPGTYFYYNNWDFNSLGVIFEQLTGISLGQAIYDWIAVPLGMGYFRPENVKYETSSKTSIRMFRIWMCPEDMAKFGQVMIDGSIVSQSWINESLTNYSLVDYIDEHSGYGYLWWLGKTGEYFMAMGSGGNFILVDRSRKIVVATKNLNGNSYTQQLWYLIFSKEAPISEATKFHSIMKE